MFRSYASALAFLVAVCHVTSAKALMMAPAPITQRVATSDMVVVGKVVSIEPKTVKAARYPGDKDKGEYQIAVVKIEDGLYGTKGLTHVRVGFIPPAPIVNPGEGGGLRPIVSSRGRPQVTLEKDQEVLVFLKAHADDAFYTAPNYFDVVQKKLAKRDNPNFAAEVAEAKRSAKLLDDPMAGLKAADAKDRYLTAVMLLSRYRMPRPFLVSNKTEPVDAAESKLILAALAGADWNAQPQGRFGDMLNPQFVFLWLGLTPKDGWNQPKDARQIPAEAKKWLAENKDSYRVQKLVHEKPPQQ